MPWKSVENYEALYEVSDSGEIRSVDHYANTGIRHVNQRIIKGRILVPHLKRTGYFTVDLCKSGKVKTTLVHRLVATAFVPNPNNLRFVNHLDSDRTNNRASNLEWVTSSENRNHGIKSGNVVFRQTRAVECIDTQQVFDQAKIAAQWVQDNYPERINGSIKVAAQNIRSSCNGRTPKAYGFTWKYHEGSTTIPEGSTRKRVEMGGPSQEGEDIV